MKPFRLAPRPGLRLLQEFWAYSGEQRNAAEKAKSNPRRRMKTSGGRVAAPASYHKLGAGIDTKVQRAGLFVGYLYSAQKLGWFFCSNEQLRLISTMISGHEFWLLQGGCVAGET
jgi:hypothetical protein